MPDQFNLHLIVGPRYRYFFTATRDCNLQPDWKTRLQSSDSGSEAILLTPWEHLARSGDIWISHTWGWFMITAQDAAKSPKTHKTTPSKQRFPWSQMWAVLLLRNSCSRERVSGRNSTLFLSLEILPWKRKRGGKKLSGGRLATLTLGPARPNAVLNGPCLRQVNNALCVLSLLGDVEGGYEAIVHWNLPSNVKLMITEQCFQKKDQQ